jgi:hypothetical protein
METINTKRAAISQMLTEFLAYEIWISYVNELTIIYKYSIKIDFSLISTKDKIIRASVLPLIFRWLTILDYSWIF